MKQLMVLLLLCLAAQNTEAQIRERIIIRNGINRRPHARQRTAHQRFSDPFQPYVSLSAGYGFPNTDQYQLADFWGMSRGNLSQTGPFTAAVDYRFTRNMSIGLMGTYGKVNAPYYSNADLLTPQFTGRLSSWSILLNLKSYLPGSRVVTPYIRTALGVNSWNQQYTDAAGNSVALVQNPSALAYQASLGANFTLSHNTGLFIEAGYGKYIVSGGLSFRL
jgi:hypothetical protein